MTFRMRDVSAGRRRCVGECFMHMDDDDCSAILTGLFHSPPDLVPRSDMFSVLQLSQTGR